MHRKQGWIYIEHHRTSRTSSSRKQMVHQTAEDRQDIKKLSTGGTAKSWGQAGHQEDEDKRDIKKMRTCGTLRSWGQAGHQGVEDRRNIKKLRTGGTSRSWEQPGHQAGKVFRTTYGRGLTGRQTAKVIQDIRRQRTNGPSAGPYRAGCQPASGEHLQ